MRKHIFNSHLAYGLAAFVYMGTSQAATIKAVVVDDVESRPVVNCRLVIAGSAISEPRVGKTNSDGVIVFTNIPTGGYQLTTEKSGYFPHPGAQINIRQSGDQTVVPIVLSKFRTLSGALIPQLGISPSHVSVYAIRIQDRHQESTSPEEQSSETDDSGNFTISQLAAGRYAVCASTGSGGGVVALPSCYKNSTSIAGATPVDLLLNESISQILIAPSASSGGSITGRVVGLPGIAPGASISVHLAVEGPRPVFVGGVESRVGGQFKFEKVPPGNYTLLAMPNEASIRPLVGIENLHVTAGTNFESDVNLRARVDVLVTASFSASSNSSGSARDASATMRRPAGGARLSVHSALLGSDGTPTITDGTGRTRLQSLVSDIPYELEILPPKGAYLKAVRQKQRELPFPLRLQGSGGDLEIEFDADPGTVTGEALRGDDPAGGAYVALVPEARLRGDLYRLATSDSDGSFRFDDVAPGSYQLLILDWPIGDLTADAGVLERLLRSATRLVVQPSSLTKLAVSVQDVKSLLRAK